ncbi:hypothetical protein BC628DRAFT_1422764 [Trametes gibbosa]|nr:hypothetical protein BC628DRAFT_1422764 [Trametes gibbosa]
MNHHPALHSLIVASHADQQVLQPLLPTLQKPSLVPPVDDDRNMVVDADGETDQDSAASVYTVPVVRSEARWPNSTRDNETTSEPRGSTESTAIARSRALSWKYIEGSTSKRSEGSFSDEYLEAFQSYHVSPSPSVLTVLSASPPQTTHVAWSSQSSPHQSHTASSPFQIVSRSSPSGPSSPHSRNEMIMNAIAGPSSLQCHPHTPPPIQMQKLPSTSTKTYSPSASLSSLTPVTTSPLSFRTVPTQRRRLNYPYVDVPPLPATRPRALYQPAREISILHEGSVASDYAGALKRALNHAASNNEALMRYNQSLPPAPATNANARRVRAVSVRSRRQDVSKDGMEVVSMSSTQLVPKERGRPLGSNAKPRKKGVHVRAKIQKLPVAEYVPVPPEEEGDKEGQEESEHRPADALEPYAPSVDVDIGELPVPCTTLFIARLRAAHVDQRQHPPTTHPVVNEKAGAKVKRSPIARSSLNQEAQPPLIPPLPLPHIQRRYPDQPPPQPTPPPQNAPTAQPTPNVGTAP